MVKKKYTPIAVSQEEIVLAQPVLEQFHQLATRLHKSGETAQIEAVLGDINVLPEGVQMAFLKALAKENHSDAADLLVALHEFSPLKTVQKEARRSLIRLESAKISPQWHPPLRPTLLPDSSDAFDSFPFSSSSKSSSSVSPLPLEKFSLPDDIRFWKGMRTDSLDIAEAQLILAWEQGKNYNEVRYFGFLLEYTFEGVKDFFTRVESKAKFEKNMGHMSRMMGVPMKDCSFDEGRGLLLAALSVNEGSGKAPHEDYLVNRMLVDHLIPGIPNLEGKKASLLGKLLNKDR